MDLNFGFIYLFYSSALIMDLRWKLSEKIKSLCLDCKWPQKISTYQSYMVFLKTTTKNQIEEYFAKLNSFKSFFELFDQFLSNNNDIFGQGWHKKCVVLNRIIKLTYCNIAPYTIPSPYLLYSNFLFPFPSQCQPNKYET